MVNEKVLAMLGKMDFQEYLEEKADCPECKHKDTLTRHVRREPQQKASGRWFVEFCSECEYWNCGFTGKRYKVSEGAKYTSDGK